MRRPISEVMAHFDRHAAELDGWSDTVRDRWRKTTVQVVMDRAELEGPDVVLDLGCGAGHIPAALALHVERAVGVDCSPNMLALARERHPEDDRVQWVLGDLREPPDVPGLTTVTMANCLRFLNTEERIKLFALLYERLPVHGLLVVGGFIWSIAPENVEGVEGWLEPELAHVLRLADVEQEMQAAGFKVRSEPLHPGVAVITAGKRGDR